MLQIHRIHIHNFDELTGYINIFLMILQISDWAWCGAQQSAQECREPGVGAKWT